MKRLLIITVLFFSFPVVFYAFREPPPAAMESLPPSPRIPAAEPKPSSIAAKAESDRAPVGFKGRPELLGELRAHSSGRFEVGPLGALTGFSNGHIPLPGEGPREAAEIFLGEYRSALGISSAAHSLVRQRSMEQNVQLVYEQSIHGLPVFGSRINLVFDSNNNIIYLSNNSYDGPAPASPRSVALERAAAVAGAGLANFRRLRGDEGERVSGAELSEHAQLGYWLTGSAIGLIYKFSFTIPKSYLGDVEVLVDATTGALLRVRSISLN